MVRRQRERGFKNSKFKVQGSGFKVQGYSRFEIQHSRFDPTQF
jgi:hypothetical protein